jgi:catechol 2,3-dioxygenase-like lactoylglutathione lyase family enzyme
MSSASLAIHHVALRVTDPERAAGFYGGVLGPPEVRRFHDAGALRSIWLQAGTAVLMLEREIKGGGESTGSGHLLAFAVDDLSEWERRLATAGIAVLDRTAATLYLRDPDGHSVGLSVYPLAP